MSTNIWVNLFGFQLYWWLCVLGQDQSVFIASGLLLLHLAFHPKIAVEAVVITLCGLVGYGVDCLLTLLGVFVFPFATSAVAPLWLLMLWLGFAATLSNSMAFLQTRMLLAMAVGAVAAPLSYIAGAALGAVNFSQGLTVTWLLLTVVWLILLPLLLRLSRVLVGERQRVA